jgi:hypothetical protein
VQGICLERRVFTGFNELAADPPRKHREPLAGGHCGWRISTVSLIIVLVTASLRLDLYLQLRTVPALSQSGLRPRPEAARVSVRVQIFSSSECSLGPTAPTESPFSCFDSGRMDPNPTPSSSGRAQAYCAPAAQPARLTTIAPRCSYEINYRWELRVRNRSKQPCEKWTLTTQCPRRRSRPWASQYSR